MLFNLKIGQLWVLFGLRGLSPTIIAGASRCQSFDGGNGCRGFRAVDAAPFKAIHRAICTDALHAIGLRSPGSASSSPAFPFDP